MSKKSKEASTINHLSEYYMTNKYDTGLNVSSKSVKKFPKSAPINAYHVLYKYLNDKSKLNECIEEMKGAIKLDFNNATVWKVSGTFYQEIGDFVSYLRSYRMAKQKDPSDAQIKKILCGLYAYFGNYKELLSESYELLGLHMSQNDTTLYIISLYLKKQYEDCLNTIDKLKSSWKTDYDPNDILFYSECILFASTILIIMSRYTDCLKYLDENINFIKDDVSIWELKLKCYENQDDNSKLLSTLEKLIDYYPENGDYYNMLEKKLSKEEMINKYFEYYEKYKSNYCYVRILELINVSDERFYKMMYDYVTPLITKCSPSIYIQLKECSIAALEVASKIISELDLPVQCEPFVILFNAHLEFRKGNYENCIKLLDNAIEHTPTITELMLWKVKYQKKMGQVKESIKSAKILWKLDPNERSSSYLLSKCLLLNGHVDLAKNKISLHSFYETETDSNIFKAQMNSFSLSCGMAYLRKGEIDESFKEYQNVINNFNDNKKTLVKLFVWASKKPRFLINTVEMLNNQSTHPHFVKAAVNIFRISLLNNTFGEKYIKDLALTSTNSKNSELLSLSSVVLAKNNLIFPAVRAYYRISEENHRYIPHYLLCQIIKSNTTYNDIILKYFKDDIREPKTCDECCRSAEGLFYAGNIEKSKEIFKEGINLLEFCFKRVLDVYIIVSIYVGFSDLKEYIKERFQTFEVDLDPDFVVFKNSKI